MRMCIISLASWLHWSELADPIRMMSKQCQFLIYQSEDGSTRIDVMLEAETLWLNQKQLTELFGKAKGTISEHIRHIFEDGELTPAATVRLFRTVQVEGGREVAREVEHYNLDMILALGFRVRSPVGVRFRQWASDKLKGYIVKGFVLDDVRLKNPGKGRDYFDELTRRLQDIRTSERRFYQKITDIYATSVNYDARHPLTQQFFATVQNKVHYAIHGQTAAELITSRADSRLPNMSLAARRIAMTMQDWITKLEGFLTLNDRAILQGAGQVSAELAKAHAEQEFDKFRVLDDQRFESDFDRMVQQLPTKKPKG